MHALELDAFPDAVLLVDDDRRCVNVNVSACALLGRAKAELIGTRIEDVVNTSAEAVMEIWNALIARGALTAELSLRDASGTTFTVSFRSRANVIPGVHLVVLWTAGDHRGIPLDVLVELISIQRSVLAPDVRPESVMEEICTRAAAMTHARGATIELHAGDHLEYRVATGSMAPFLGFRVPIGGSLSGLAFRTHEVLVCTDSELDPRVDRAATRKVGARSMIVVPLLADGQVVGVLKVVSAQPNAFDSAAVDLLRLIAGFLGTAMFAARANEARRVLAERERARLVELERLRDEMTSLLVHDLRSPLTVIMANLDYVREQLPPTSTEAVEAAIDALKATQRLDVLIKALLETAKLEQGRFGLRREAVRVRPFVDQLVQPRAVAARTRQLVLRIDIADEVVVSADRDLLHRVIDNILDNAFRYTNPGGRITIAASRTNDSIVMRIGNTGAALPPEMKTRAFEKFEQAEPKARRNFGLGLYFCKLAIEAHGGRIWADSSQEDAAIFAFELAAA